MIKTQLNTFKYLAVVLSILLLVSSCKQQKRYVSYKVKEGETMRDIAKKLNVKTKDLLRLNPQVNNDPEANTTIVIPNTKKRDVNVKTDTPKKIDDVTTEEAPEKNVDVEKETEEDVKTTVDSEAIIEKVLVEYETHTVAPKETVWALTQKYKISKDELLRLNPEYADLKSNKLRIGQVLKVKAIEKKVYVSLEEELKDYVTYTVSKNKENINNLSRFYNLSKDDLIALNSHLPNIKEEDLKVGDIVKIRPLEEKLETDEYVTIYQDSIDIDDNIKLTMLIPFKADEYTEKRPVDIFRSKKNRLANIVTDFYMGAEVAIDSIKNQGVNVEVKVFDTGNRGNKVAEIIEKNDLDDEDVIIGPFYSTQVKLVTDKVKAPVVFPHFSDKQDEFSSSKLVKSSPDIKAYVNKLVSYLKSKYNGETIFVVGDGKPKSDIQVSAIVAGLQKHDSIDKVNVLKPKDDYIKKERFTEEMQEKSHCWVIMTSDDKVAVADALNSMVVLPEGVTAQVFAVEKNNAYDKIDNNKLARMEFIYVTDNYADEDDSSTKEFNKKYRAKNYSLPTKYATKGFDITYDVLMRLASGNNLNKTFKQGASIRVANKFNYRKKLFGSTSNSGLFIVKYNTDLSLSRLR